MKNFYQVLGLQPNATGAQIREKYLFLAKELHPDRNAHPGAAEAFKQVAEAYEVLRSPLKRRAYDLQFKVRQFVPPVQPGGAVDLINVLRGMAAGRVPQRFMDALTPVLERKLDEHGVTARAATAEQILEAVGWLKPKRRKRRA